MRNLVLLVTVLLLPLLTGCKEMISLQMAQDQPEDIQQLLEHDEFARARQLTGKYPAIDTPELQVRIATQEVAYEDNIYTWARSLESKNDLLGAVQLLSDALQKVPNSDMLRDYRNRLETERLEKIRVNEKHQLIARAEYILSQKALYQQYDNLKQPSLIHRWEHARNRTDLENVAKQLRNHGKYAFEHDDLESAQECLQLSKSIHNTPKTRQLLDKLQATRDSQEKVAQKQAHLNKAKKQDQLKQRQAKETRKYLDATQDALSVNDLAVARENFIQIPLPSSKSSEVTALQEDLDLALTTRVTELTSRGDAKYRADNVISAIKIWAEALELDPENQDLKERLDRAARVLARLEQLKRQQRR